MIQNFNYVGDMSASRRPPWVRIPNNCKSISIGAGWPATGTPVGVFTVEVCEHGINGTAGAVYPITITTQPAGSAGGFVLDGIETSARFITMPYARTSGGAGASITDSSGVAGRLPTITFKE